MNAFSSVPHGWFIAGGDDGEVDAPVLPLLVLVAALQDPAPPPAQDDGSFQVDARAWLVMPSGWVTITLGSRPGSGTPALVDRNIDLDTTAVPELEGRWEFLDAHAVGVRMALLGLSGTHENEGTFFYHGLQFDPGRSVRTDLDLELVQVDYQYRFLRTDSLRLQAHAGAEYWSYAGRLRTEDSLAPLDTQRTFASGFWLAGLDADWAVHPWLEVRAGALGGFERSRQNFFDLQADVLLRPWSSLSFSAGYRMNVLRFRQSTNESDLHVQGPQIGAELRF